MVSAILVRPIIDEAKVMGIAIITSSLSIDLCDLQASLQFSVEAADENIAFVTAPYTTPKNTPIVTPRITKAAT